ncbi:MAG: VOC family protein [Alteromonadaceae bacterium]|nr:VOC family protein [Alteromonadaceae bacterium]
MNKQLSAISIIVADYDEAIAYYTEKLGFHLVEDLAMGDKRWVVVSPSAGCVTQIVLAKASSPEQKQAIGQQGAGRVWLFLQTDDFERDFKAFSQAGVKFHEQPRYEPYGTVAVFEDLYGNKWDLSEKKA